MGADLADMQLINKYKEETRFYYELVIIIINMHDLFLRRRTKVKCLLIHFKKLHKHQVLNKRKSGR